MTNTNNEIKKKKFKQFLPVVILTVFALIAVGGIVRSTGSGMGCPDWPKCFGQYVPPLSAVELPLDYKTKFAVAGKKVAEFSAFKTWVEYINRLFGVWTGIALLILSYYSFGFKKERKDIFWFTQLALLLVILNGWLGSKVVATHLKPVIITAHMLLAIVLVFVLQKIKYCLPEYASSDRIKDAGKYQKVVWGLLILTLVQVVFGTQVREQIDEITNNFPSLARGSWVGRLDWVFYVHRSVSLAILLTSFYLLKNVMKTNLEHERLQEIGKYYFLTLIGVLVAGVALAYLSFPPSMQPLHLLLSIMLVSYQYELGQIISNSKGNLAV